jgi:hypothetical protein
MTHYFLQKISIFLLLITTSVLVQGQHHNCGTLHQDDVKIKHRMLDNRRQHHNLMSLYNQARSGNNIVYVPIQFHIINKTDGTGGESVQDVLDNLCKLNADFAFINIEFYLANPIRFINKDLLYTNDVNSGMASFFMEQFNVDDVVNIFVGDEIRGIPGGTTLGYYDPSLDAIYAIKDAVNGLSFTLTHELGHFFSLPHTFSGWERQDYNTVTLNANGRTPSVLPNGSLVENVARSGGEENCQIAGDGFCDTDPSYLFGFYGATYNTGPGLCEHASAAIDPTGRLFRPDLIRPATRFGMSEGNPAFTELLTTNAFVGTYFPARTLLVVETSFTPVGGNPTTMWSDTIGGTDSTDYNLQTGSNLIGNGANKVQTGFISMGDYYLNQEIRVNGSSMVTTSLTVPAEYKVTPGGSYSTEMSALELLNASGTTITSGISIDVEERLYHRTTGLVSAETWTIQVTTPLPSGATALPIGDLYQQKNTIAGCTFDIQLTAPYTTITRTSADNIMSYYDEGCGSLFSTEQGVAMQLDIASRGLATLYPSPTTTLINTQATTNYPTANVTTPNNVVDFSWNPVTAASYYHVYVYQVNSLGMPLINGDRLDFMTTNTNLSVALKPSTLYAWEVSPLNATSFCDPSTKSTTIPFETGLSVAITTVNIQKTTLQIYPNPIRNNKSLTMELTSEGVSKAQISIFNSLGQEVMFGQSIELVDGLNKSQLDVQSLSAGLYLIQVKTKEGIQSKKLIVE